jgi:hypothetical protein
LRNGFGSGFFLALIGSKQVQLSQVVAGQNGFVSPTCQEAARAVQERFVVRGLLIRLYSTETGARRGRARRERRCSQVGSLGRKPSLILIPPDSDSWSWVVQQAPRGGLSGSDRHGSSVCVGTRLIRISLGASRPGVLQPKSRPEGKLLNLSYAAGSISVTWTGFLATSSTPVTLTFLPSNCLAFS